MTANLRRFLDKIERGEFALGGCVSFADAAVTEVVAAAGFDFVFIDGEHSEFDREEAIHHVMATHGTNCASFYRVPSAAPEYLQGALRAAADGIIVPMVMNAEEAESAIRGMKGKCWSILQLEHIDAYRDLDRILKVPGLDSILIGPFDFSTSMGKPGQWDDPEVRAVFDDACRRIRAAGITLGVSLDVRQREWRARGAEYMAVKGDATALLERFRQVISELKEL